MSVDNSADGSPPVGNDFQADLQRVGQTVGTALQNLDDDADQTRAARAITDHFEENGIPPEEAIIGAWFFILSFAE
jgi:hypothetical protein